MACNNRALVIHQNSEANLTKKQPYYKVVLQLTRKKPQGRMSDTYSRSCLVWEPIQLRDSRSKGVAKKEKQISNVTYQK